MSHPVHRKRRWPRVIAIVVIALVTVYVVGSIVGMNLVYSKLFGRNELPPINVELTYDDVDHARYPRRIVTFPSGDAELTGYVYGESREGSAGQPKGVIVIAHGIASGADSHLAETMYFADAGWAVLAFDGTGTRSSGGEAVRGLPQTKLDVEAAVAYLQEDPALAGLPVVLFGHSMGGYAVTSALADGIDVEAVVCVSAFDSPNETTRAFLEYLSKPLAALEYPFASLHNRMEFGADANVSAVEGINATDAPVMIVAGTEDEVVPQDAIGIPAHADELTNPNAVIVWKDDAPCNHHNTIWLTPAAAELTTRVWEERDAVQSEYDGDVPEDVRTAFLANVDRKALVELDEDFMAEVVAFYETAI
ncbi:MAG: alpha/beta hydrolase [Coriobacteriales bacterium]|jgi:pimeloyl-ACP methyl ester carboxylesterase